jgi:hypothetical protein
VKKTQKIVRPSVSQLSADAIHTGSVHIDWRDLSHSGRGYTAYGAETCETCGAAVVLTEGQGGESHKHYAASGCDGYLPTFEGPAMNYFYELPTVADVYEAAQAIAHLPLCLIEWHASSGHDGWALALTGGGMDLSWDICEAFMVLGYLPPLKYAGRLPDIGKHGASARYVLRGARKSIRVGRNWLQNDARTVARMATRVREADARRKEAR